MQTPKTFLLRGCFFGSLVITHRTTNNRVQKIIIQHSGFLVVRDRTWTITLQNVLSRFFILK